MILQRLMFPDYETCSDFEMYFRTDGADAPAAAGERRPGPAEGRHAYGEGEAHVIHVPRWCRLDGSTFFNGFSIGKWRANTRIDNLRLTLTLSGAFQARLVHWTMIRGRCEVAVVAEKLCRAPERTAFALNFPPALADRGVYGWELYAVGEDNAFYGGQYETDVDEEALNPVDIAMDICTFRREAYVQRNLNALNRDILNNPGSPLHGHLEVFIADNGRTLDAARLQSGAVHVFPNRNVGGAGGFARGMIEIMDAPRAFTHVLVMDDDVLFSEDTLLRAYNMLRLLKPECGEKSIAGALMRLDARHTQYENGATWSGRYPQSLKSGLDLRDIMSVLKNEFEETMDYAGWWFCCIPMTAIQRVGLPLPLFVHFDDVEYGLRTGRSFITLNGVCVWHESFDNRYSSSMEYYDMRNTLITSALHLPGFTGVQAAKLLLHMLVTRTTRYRYNSCELMLNGLDDFFAGADHVMGLDPEQTHARVLSMAYRFQPIEQLGVPFSLKQYEANLNEKKGRLKTIRIYLLNGLFLPGRGTGFSSYSEDWPGNYYRRDAVVIFDEIGHQGILVKRDRRATLRQLRRTFSGMLRLVKGYRAAAETYRRALPEMTSRAFWEAYLRQD